MYSKTTRKSLLDTKTAGTYPPPPGGLGIDHIGGPTKSKRVRERETEKKREEWRKAATRSNALKSKQHRRRGSSRARPSRERTKASKKSLRQVEKSMTGIALFDAGTSVYGSPRDMDAGPTTTVTRRKKIKITSTLVARFTHNACPFPSPLLLYRRRQGTL